MNQIPRLREVMDAEQRLDEAEKALRDFETNADQWGAHQSIDKLGRRTLHLNPSHFDRQEALRRERETAEGALRAVWARLITESDRVRG